MKTPKFTKYTNAEKLAIVLDYIIDNEKTSFEENGKRRDHVYALALALRQEAYDKAECENGPTCMRCGESHHPALLCEK